LISLVLSVRGSLAVFFKNIGLEQLDGIITQSFDTVSWQGGLAAAAQNVIADVLSNHGAATTACGN
jgi:hypothetical protein